MLLMCGLMLWFIYAARRRIPFAAAHLQAGCEATAAHPWLFGVALLMLAAQAVWSITWSAAALGVEHKLSAWQEGQQAGGGSSEGNSAGVVVMFLMLLSLYWGSSVFISVMHFTSASVVGSWWFLSTPESPVRYGLKRAWTTSFGSIGGCGAAVVVRPRQL
jgi:hypothetical protein